MRQDLSCPWQDKGGMHMHLCRMQSEVIAGGLCRCGLGQCGDKFEGKRPFYSY